MHRVLGASLAWLLVLHAVTVSGERPQYNCTRSSYEGPPACLPYSLENQRIQDLEAGGTIFGDITESPHQLTESDLRDYCKLNANVYTCHIEHFLQCTAGPSGSALEGLADRIIKAANKICNRPDLLPEVRVLATCGQTALRAYENRTRDEKRRFNEHTTRCMEKLDNPPNAVSSLFGPPGRRIPYALIDNETAVLGGVCCAVKRFFNCLPRINFIRQVCTFEAVNLARGIFAELLGPEYLNCAALPNFGCPEGPEPVSKGRYGPGGPYEN